MQKSRIEIPITGVMLRQSTRGDRAGQIFGAIAES